MSTEYVCFADLISFFDAFDMVVGFMTHYIACNHYNSGNLFFGTMLSIEKHLLLNVVRFLVARLI